MSLKPKLLDIYIVKRFLSTFAIMLILIIGIVIIFDISEKIDDFVTRHATLKEIVFDYYMNFIPYFMNMFSPIFVFLTVIFFTSRMAVRSEIIAILSCGISFHRLLRPYLFSAFLIAFVSLMINLYVIPPANAIRNAFEAKYVRHKSLPELKDLHYQISPGQFVYVGSFSRWNNTAYDFTLEKIKGHEILSKLHAQSAKWDSTMQGWKLYDYYIRDYIPGSLRDKITSGRQVDTVLNLNIDDFYRSAATVQDLSYGELRKLIATQRMRGDANVKYSLIEEHQRWALPFSAFILTIMGLALSSKKKRGGTGWNLAIGLALSFSYILFIKFSQMFVYTGSLPPAVAIWLPNFIYAIIAGVLYYIAPK